MGRGGHRGTSRDSRDLEGWAAEGPSDERCPQRTPSAKTGYATIRGRSSRLGRDPNLLHTAKYARWVWKPKARIAASIGLLCTAAARGPWQG